MPYVYFPPMCNPHKVLQAYKELAAALEMELPQIVTESLEECLALQQQVREKLQGAGYIYGNSPYNFWELNTYLAGLGLQPLMIQMSTLKNKEAKMSCCNMLILTSAKVPIWRRWNLSMIN